VHNLDKNEKVVIDISESNHVIIKLYNESENFHSLINNLLQGAKKRAFQQ